MEESEIDRKKRELAERMAAIRARTATSKPNGLGVPAAPVPVVPPPAASSPAANGTSDEAKKAEAQRRIAEVKARMAAQRAQAGNLYAKRIPLAKKVCSAAGF